VFSTIDKENLRSQQFIMFCAQLLLVTLFHISKKSIVIDQEQRQRSFCANVSNDSRYRCRDRSCVFLSAVHVDECSDEIDDEVK